MRCILRVGGVLVVLCGILVAVLMAAGSAESLGEFQALRRELGKIDLKGPSAKTTGWDNVSEAEWPFFALTYFGYSGCNLAQKSPSDAEEVLGEVRWAIDALMTQRISGFVTPHFGSPFEGEIPTPAVLVHGHVFYLMMRYRDLGGDKRYDDVLHRIARSLSSAYAKESSGILRSYNGMWWPTDNLPALAGLKRYDKAFGTDLAKEPSEKWVNSMRTHYCDPKSGLICGYVSLKTKQPLGGPRGVGIMFAFPFLVEVDQAFAKQQYALAQKHLVGVFMGFKGIREFPEGQEGKADVDSGEIIMGFGQAASGFGIAAAAAMGDEVLHRHLLLSKSLALGSITTMTDEKSQETLIPVVGRCVILYGETQPYPDHPANPK